MSSLETITLVTSAIYGAIGAAAALLNGWAFIIVVVRRLWVKNSFLSYIAVLAFVDVLIGADYVLFLVVVADEFASPAFATAISSPLVCYAIMYAQMVGLLAADTLMLVIAIDRCYAVGAPFHYAAKGTRPIIVGCAVAAAVGFVVATCGFGALLPSAPLCSFAYILDAAFANFYTNFRYALVLAGVAFYVAMLALVHVHKHTNTAALGGGSSAQARITHAVVVLVAVHLSTMGVGLALGVVAAYAGVDETTGVTLQLVSIIFQCASAFASFFVFPIKFDEIRGPIAGQLSFVLGCGCFGRHQAPESNARTTTANGVEQRAVAWSTRNNEQRAVVL